MNALRQRPFTIELATTRIPGLPSLGWAVELDRRQPEAGAYCGQAVEIDERGLIAGAWAGLFADRAIATAATSVGTAFRLTGQGAVAVCGTASPSHLVFVRVGSRLVVSNLIALALAVADDRLQLSSPFNHLDLYSYFIDSRHYRRSLATERGKLSVLYQSTRIGRGLRPSSDRRVDPLAFSDYASYRGLLLSETRRLFENAADRGRGFRFQPIASISAGYDSPAAAAIARDGGCREAFTFAEPVNAPEIDSDSGAAIAERLGLSVQEFRTFAYKDRTDMPEIEFAATSFGPGQVYLAAAEATLAGRIVVTGFGGDRVWAPDYGRKKTRFPFYIGGYGEAEFNCRIAALNLALPMIAARHAPALGKLSRSAEMRPWSVGGDFDRPIARRIVEEAGVGRGEFARRKRRVTPTFLTTARRQPPLGYFFSAATVREFEAWFSREQPMKHGMVVRHALLANSIGRMIWSGKLDRAMRRIGRRWPPFRGKLLRLKNLITKNHYVFTWAVGVKTAAYRRSLVEAADRSAKLR